MQCLYVCMYAEAEYAGHVCMQSMQSMHCLVCLTCQLDDSPSKSRGWQLLPQIPRLLADWLQHWLATWGLTNASAPGRVDENYCTYIVWQQLVYNAHVPQWECLFRVGRPVSRHRSLDWMPSTGTRWGFTAGLYSHLVSYTMVDKLSTSTDCNQQQKRQQQGATTKGFSCV